METTYDIKADGLPHIQKVAGRRLDYTFDLTDYFTAIGATMGEYTVRAHPGLAVNQADCIKTGNAVTVFIDGGTAGYTCPVHLDFEISGANARDDTRTIVIDVVATR